MRRGWGVVVAVLALAGCGSDPVERPDPARSGDLIVRATGASALAPLGGGGLRFGELEGRIRDVDSGRVRDVTRVRVSLGGQRGLLGLAVDDRGRTFAAYTEPAPPRHLVVAQVAPGSARLVWRGPPSRDLANGGHIAFAPDGRLTIGIGDLQDPPKVDDPRTLNGKLLTLDPDGVASQRPRVLSGGWNNPYAFAWTPDGRLWVADNAPGEQPERIARGDRAGRGAPQLALRRRAAPSGLVATARGELVLCGYVSRRLERVRVGSGRPRIDPEPLATDCLLGVVQLDDGALAYATGRAILRIEP